MHRLVTPIDATMFCLRRAKLRGAEMPVFISYSSTDKEFVDKFAVQLVQKKVPVWLDRWELRAGDSLITKIQEAVAGASALLVILSKASVASEWCTKELNAGLMRELDEKRVVVVPILLEDCDMPIFLKEKLYADFRTDFDDGLKTVIEAIAKVTNEYMARIDEPDWHSDWAIDWERDAETGLFTIRLTIVEQANAQPYSCLTEVSIICSPEATEQYLDQDIAGNGDVARRHIVGNLAKGIEEGVDLTVLLDDQFKKGFFVEIKDKFTNVGYGIAVTSRRLGEDTGRDILLRTGDQIVQIYRHMEEVAAKGD